MAEKEGRPTVMTPEIIGKLEQAFLMGCSDKEACLFAEIHPSTLYDYQKLNPRFTERKELLKENPVFKARMKVVEDMERNVDSARWFLERKKKDEFSLRSELTGRDGKDLPTPILGYVSSNNGNSQDNVPQEAHQGSAGGDISLQDSLDNPVPDTSSAIG